MSDIHITRSHLMINLIHSKFITSKSIESADLPNSGEAGKMTHQRRLPKRYRSINRGFREERRLLRTVTLCIAGESNGRRPGCLPFNRCREGVSSEMFLLIIALFNRRAANPCPLGMVDTKGTFQPMECIFPHCVIIWEAPINATLYADFRLEMCLCV